MTRAPLCAKCHHLRSRHRTHECRQTWQTRGQTFMGVSASHALVSSAVWPRSRRSGQ